MVSAGYYRAEADRCRKLAASAKDTEAANGWRALARDYSALADSIDTSLYGPQAMRVPMQQQPIQQQQSESEPEDKT
jgi:hypothetical protein